MQLRDGAIVVRAFDLHANAARGGGFRHGRQSDAMPWIALLNGFTAFSGTHLVRPTRATARTRRHLLQFGEAGAVKRCGVDHFHRDHAIAPGLAARLPGEVHDDLHHALRIGGASSTARSPSSHASPTWRNSVGNCATSATPVRGLGGRSLPLAQQVAQLGHVDMNRAAAPAARSRHLLQCVDLVAGECTDHAPLTGDGVRRGVASNEHRTRPAPVAPIGPRRRPTCAPPSGLSRIGFVHQRSAQALRGAGLADVEGGCTPTGTSMVSPVRVFVYRHTARAAPR